MEVKADLIKETEKAVQLKIYYFTSSAKAEKDLKNRLMWFPKKFVSKAENDGYYTIQDWILNKNFDEINSNLAHYMKIHPIFDIGYAKKNLEKIKTKEEISKKEEIYQKALSLNLKKCITSVILLFLFRGGLVESKTLRARMMYLANLSDEKTQEIEKMAREKLSIILNLDEIKKSLKSFIDNVSSVYKISSYSFYINRDCSCEANDYYNNHDKETMLVDTIYLLWHLKNLSYHFDYRNCMVYYADSLGYDFDEMARNYYGVSSARIGIINMIKKYADRKIDEKLILAYRSYERYFLNISLPLVFYHITKLTEENVDNRGIIIDKSIDMYRAEDLALNTKSVNAIQTILGDGNDYIYNINPNYKVNSFNTYDYWLELRNSIEKNMFNINQGNFSITDNFGILMF